ncbi:MAG: hypothetical protein ACTTI3_08410 [Treponema sp.]
MNIPVEGWYAIAFIATLAFIVIMRLAKRGVDLSVGDKKLSIGGLVDEKIGKIKEAADKVDEKRQADDELRKKLFRMAADIDEKTRADERRVVRLLKEKITAVFEDNIKCSMPALTAIEAIKDIFEERVDRNQLRERLAFREREKYIADILFFCKKEYMTFLQRIPALPCGSEQYPEWGAVEPKIKAIIEEFADDVSKILIERCEEKIEVYTAERANFNFESAQKLCVDFPIEKNRGYIERLKKG